MRQLQRCRQHRLHSIGVECSYSAKKQFFQVSHEYASDTRSHFRSHGDTLFLREISAIEMESIHFKHKFNVIEKGSCGHRLVTAFIEKMFTGFQSTIMRDRRI